MQSPERKVSTKFEQHAVVYDGGSILKNIIINNKVNSKKSDENKKIRMAQKRQQKL